MGQHTRVQPHCGCDFHHLFLSSFRLFMDSLSMILLTIPIFWPVVMELDITFVTMAELHAHRAADALAAGIQLAPDMMESVQTSLAAGMELTREQIKALELERGKQGGIG